MTVSFLGILGSLGLYCMGALFGFSIARYMDAKEMKEKLEQQLKDN